MKIYRGEAKQDASKVLYVGNVEAKARVHNLRLWKNDGIYIIEKKDMLFTQGWSGR